METFFFFFASFPPSREYMKITKLNHQNLMLVLMREVHEDVPVPGFRHLSG